MKINKLLYGICFILAFFILVEQICSYSAIKSAKTCNSEASNEKKVALTFDDGPHPIYTERLLTELEKRNVKATFFVIGENAELNPELIKKMNEAGHLIGNHTYSHIQLTEQNKVSFEEELIKTNKILKGITGKEVEYIRPPYGTWDKTLENKLNMFPILWTVDPMDWCKDNPVEVAQFVIENVKAGDIILLHDCYETSVEASLMIVDELKKQGYTFVTVDEILFD